MACPDARRARTAERSKGAGEGPGKGRGHRSKVCRSMQATIAAARPARGANCWRCWRRGKSAGAQSNAACGRTCKLRWVNARTNKPDAGLTQTPPGCAGAGFSRVWWSAAGKGGLGQGVCSLGKPTNGNGRFRLEGGGKLIPERGAWARARPANQWGGEGPTNRPLPRESPLAATRCSRATATAS